MSDLWSEVIRDTSGPRPYQFTELPLAFSQKSGVATCEISDEIRKGRVKALHTQGLVAKVKYVPTEDNLYTGILGSGSDTVLLRFSESSFLHEQSEGLNPSVALKFLKDGVPSDNIVA